MIGTKLAHYTITGKLGEGGMGVVYEAIDDHLDREVALKLLSPEAVANQSRKQRFVQEAKTASALNHPNIVTIYDIASADGTDFLAMELVRGRTLEQALSRGKLRLADALKYSMQISDALAAAHAVGIVHRDLKPGNIMINERGDVKVLDFGLAKLTDRGTITQDDETRTGFAITGDGVLVGTVPYMSPEQAEGRQVDARSDIFSFGSVMYEMLTGKPAFRGANSMAIIASILRDEPEPLSATIANLQPELERVVSRCLRKQLDRRSQSMAEVHVSLRELKEGLDSGTLEALPRVTARSSKPWIYYAAGALLLGVIFSIVFYFWPRSVLPSLETRVLTSFVGAHYSPTLSPDGKQFAFSWNGDGPNGKQHVYISLIGKGTPLRLTPEEDEDYSPSWSPDGESIAFVREIDKLGAFELAVMPALGGRPHSVVQGVLGGGANWSPDSKWLLWSQRDDSGAFSIRVAPAGGGEPRRLFVAKGRGDFDVAVSPDGRQIVFCRTSGAYDSDLYVADFRDGLSMGTIRPLTYDHEPKGTPIWTNGGKEITYIVGIYTDDISLFRVPASGGSPHRIEGIGANAASLTYAASANRLLYSTFSMNFDIRRIDLSAPGEIKPQRFLSSTRYEASPTYSPDGKRIAFDSNRGGLRQIWVADADGGNPVPLTSFASGVAGSPKWSPDGKFIAFDARPETNADVYTVPAAGGPVRRLTDSPGEDNVPSWSPDGKWIYFGSVRAGTHEIFRMHPDGSGVEQLTRNGGEFGEVTFDGKWLYYSVSKKGLWKMAADGGAATPVLPREALYKNISFTLTEQGIWAFGKSKLDKYPVVFYPFDGGKPRTITALSEPIENFPGISPDRRYLLYSSPDPPVFEIMQVNNFR